MTSVSLAEQQEESCPAPGSDPGEQNTATTHTAGLPFIFFPL